MAIDPSERRAVDRQTAADMYGVSFDVIKKAIAKGELKAKKNGNRYLIGLDALAAWFNGLTDAVLPD